jgi:hypothetical protein
MRPVLTTVLATLALSTTLAGTLAGTAHADLPPGRTEPGYGLDEPNLATGATRTERYGGQILVADVAWFAATMLVGSLEARSSRSYDDDGSYDDDPDTSIAGVMAMGYFVTGPAIHLKHGNTSGAAKSLAARALLPMGGAVLGMVAFMEDCRGDDLGCGFAPIAGMVIGGAAGMVGAMALDWTVLGKHEVEVPGAGVIARVQPRLDVGKDRVGVALGGSF